MLISLAVRDFAIIEAAEVRFGPGLNVVSGETGAGKSILFQALGLLLGLSATADQVRTGCRSATVEAELDLSRHPRALAVLAGEGHDVQERVHLKRTISSSGGGRAYVDGRPVTLAVLRRLARHGFDFSGQHEHRVLLDERCHLDLLDDYADLGAERQQMSAAWATLQAAQAELSRLELAESNADERGAWLAHQVAELEALGPRPDEVAELILRLERLEHAEQLALGSARVVRDLYEGDASVATVLLALEDQLGRMSRADPAYSELAQQLEGARITAEEVARDVQRLAGDLSAEPGAAESLRGRLGEYNRLVRKHRCAPESLADELDRLVAEQAELESLEPRLEEARRTMSLALEEARRLAQTLHEARVEAAPSLEQAVASRLERLAMPAARFEVRLLPLEEAGPAGLDEHGRDRVSLYLSANPGEAPRPLVRVASGGELSRVLLALKVALSSRQSGGVFVFDEIDTGVGGATAERIGQELAALAQAHQLLVITHLPQIAAFADVWLAVGKQVSKGRTRTRVRSLVGDQRVDELARMVSGQAPSAESRAWARQLLAGGGRHKIAS